jgi:hypothetical protein
MSEFISSVELLGDDAVTDAIITRTINELKDNMTTKVGPGAFYRCTNLTKVDLAVAKEIADNAFYNTSNLTTLILRRTEGICELKHRYAFNGSPINTGTGRIYVPRALLEAYQADSNWKHQALKLAIEDYPDICG